VPFEIIKPGTQIDFIGRWRVAAALSLTLILLGLAAIPVRGFRLGIDFQGGNEVQIRFTDGSAVDEGRIRGVMQDLGIEGASVVRYGTADVNEFLLKFAGERQIQRGEGMPAVGAPPGAATEAEAEEAALDPEAAPTEIETAGEGGGAPVEDAPDTVKQLVAALEGEIGPLELERVEFVGPKVGAELRRAGLQALGLACLLILAYIGFRFSARFAPGAVVALVHDVLITAGVWVILGIEFDLRVLAALLAIIGYSLNDTIIVYDRIRENMEIRTTRNMEDVLNQSVNQTLSRTLLTSLTTLLAVLSLLFLGGEVIRPFALAMAIGIGVGTYSSVYVAAPTLLFLERRFGGAGAS
jgi:preprotein translocase subunit SecF